MAFLRSTGLLGKFNRAADEMKNQALKAARTTAAVLRTGAGRVQQFARAHPYWTCAIGAALVGAGVCLVAPQAALGALGWQAAGPVAGTFAPWIQSAVYGAYTTGMFSALQAFTMTGAAAPVAMVVAGCAGLVAGTGLIAAAMKERFVPKRNVE